MFVILVAIKILLTTEDLNSVISLKLENRLSLQLKNKKFIQNSNIMHLSITRVKLIGTTTTIVNGVL